MRKAVLLILLAVAAACGGGQNPTNTPAGTTPLPEATQPLEVTLEVTAESTAPVIAPTQVIPVETPTPEVAIPNTSATTSAKTPTEWCAGAVPAPEPATRQFTQMEMTLQDGVDYRAILCTESGAVYIDLFEDYTPLTVSNFVFLAQNGYYNNTTFHRVLEGFMAQGGDPTGTGTGNPGYMIPDENLAFFNFNRAGWLAMANAGPNTGGSQFFITTAPSPHLWMKHTVFGEVLEGQESVNTLRLRSPGEGVPAGSRLDTVLVITDPGSVVTRYNAPLPMSGAEIERELETLQTTLAQVLPVSSQLSYQRIALNVTLENKECQFDQAPVVSMTMNLAPMGSQSEAVNASTVPPEGMENTGTPIGGSPIYSRSVQACGTEAVEGLVKVWRGPYVMTIGATLPSSQAANLNGVLQVVLNTFDAGLANVFQRVLR